MKSFSVFMILLLPISAHAAVISGGDAGYTTAPGDDPGWSRVGRVGTNGSGVYLGNGWVITANHVNAKSSFTVDGDPTYTLLAGPGNTYRVTEVGGGTGIDLYMFRVGVSPGTGLYGLGLMDVATSLPSGGTDGSHIGTGVGQTSTTPTTWYVDTTGGANNWSWSTNMSDPHDLTVDGYHWDTGTSRDTRWNLQVYDRSFTSGNTEYIATSFESTAGYGMVADNDSGSGLFFKSGGTWEVAGIAVSVGTYFNQPADTGMIGNESIFIDLTQYEDQITAVVVPEASSLALAGIVLFSSLGLVRRHLQKGTSPEWQ